MDQENYDHYQMQNALQQQQIDAQQMAYMPQLHEQAQQNQAVLVAQTDPKRVVKEIVLRLKGLEEKPDGSLIQVSQPKMNKEGIDNVIFMLDSHINDNIRLSHLTNDEIGHIMDSLQEDLVDDLTLNWRHYGIKRKTDLDSINNSILINVFNILKRAEGQNEKNWLGKISWENISGMQRLPQPKKESWLNKFRLG